MTFAIGQKVICIKGAWRYKNKKSGINLPKFMQIYTIRAYCACADIPAVLLEEITNCNVVFNRTLKRGEASFAEYFFRALEDIKDEIEQECEA